MGYLHSGHETHSSYTCLTVAGGNEDAHPYPALKDGAIDTRWLKEIHFCLAGRKLLTND